MAASETPSTYSGQVTVTTAGTRVNVSATEKRVESVTFIGTRTNTGRIYLGGADVAATTNDGIGAEESITFTAKGQLDLKDFWVDASVSSEKVEIYAVKA